MANYIVTENVKKAVCLCLINNPEVVKYIVDASDDLMYTNVFPYYRNPSTITNVKTLITMAADIKGISKNKLSNIQLTIWVVCSSQTMVVDNHIRTDILAQEIIDTLNKLTGTWVGEVEFKTNNEDSIGGDYCLRILTFTFKDIVPENIIC